MQMTRHDDGTVTLRLQPGDYVAQDIEYQGEDTTWERLTVINGKVDLGQFSIQLPEGEVAKVGEP